MSKSQPVSPAPSPPSPSASPPPNQPHDEDLTADLPGFQTTPAAAGSLTTSTPAGAGDGGPGAGSTGPSATSAPTSSPASTRDTVVYRQVVEGLAVELVGVLSLAVRWLRARRRPYLPPEVWKATEAEQQAIGKPLARIAARRAPIGTLASEDVVDGFTAGLATARYAAEHGHAEDAADKQFAAAVAAGMNPGAGLEDPDQPAPATPASPIAEMLR